MQTLGMIPRSIKAVRDLGRSYRANTTRMSISRVRLPIAWRWYEKKSADHQYHCVLV